MRKSMLLGAACAIVACAIMLGLGSLAPAGEKVGPDPKEVQEVLDKALGFLKTQQTKEGSFAPKIAGPGVASIVAAGLLRNGVSPKEPAVASTLTYLEGQVKKDGGIYSKGLANYTTSVGIMALREANT